MSCVKDAPFALIMSIHFEWKWDKTFVKPMAPAAANGLMIHPTGQNQNLRVEVQAIGVRAKEASVASHSRPAL